MEIDSLSLVYETNSEVYIMENLKKNPQNAGFLVLGMALLVVGISVDNIGLIAAGIVFAILGIVAPKRKPEKEKYEDDA